MHRTTPFAVALAAALAAGGCSGTKPHYVETGDPNTNLVTMDVDMRDIQNAASGMLQSLLEQGTLRNVPQPPAQLVVERVKNDTSSDFRIDELMYRMREQLVNSGQAQVVTTWGGNAEAKDAQDELRRREFKGEKFRDPDFSLTGRITELSRRLGDERQVTYSFRLTLTDRRTGNEAWTKVVDMTKKGERPAVGF